MITIEPKIKHNLHIPLCAVCAKPLIVAEGGTVFVNFFDPVLKRNIGLVHEVCERVRMYEIGMTSHLVSAESAEA